jgi:hypothetical protein
MFAFLLSGKHGNLKSWLVSLCLACYSRTEKHMNTINVFVLRSNTLKHSTHCVGCACRCCLQLKMGISLSNVQETTNSSWDVRIQKISLRTTWWRAYLWGLWGEADCCVANSSPALSMSASRAGVATAKFYRSRRWSWNVRIQNTLTMDGLVANRSLRQKLYVLIYECVAGYGWGI